MSYLDRVFENTAEIVTIPNAIIYTGAQTFRGVVDLSAATVTGLTLTASVVAPDASDGAALGSTSLMWSDLFLASGAVINFNNGNMTITHSAAALTVAGGTLAVTGSQTITAATLAADSGRSLKIDGTVAAAAHADGYGTIELNANFSGAIAGPYAAASSTWVNLAGGTTVVAGPMICTRNDGIYGPAGLTLTNAKMVIGGRMQFVIDDGANPGSVYLWSTNIYSNAFTALFDINSIHDFSDTTAKSTGGIAIPFMKVNAGGEAPNTVYYLNLYTS